MHGLVNRSIQCFIADTYGGAAWQAVVAHSGLPFDNFDALKAYDAALTGKMIASGSAVLNKPRAVMLEDLGTYLVTNPNMNSIRRLLRFSGATFVEFLLALEDLPDRARLALPDLDLPELELVRTSTHGFELYVRSPQTGAGSVMAGIVRAMADDYGALVVMDVLPTRPGEECITLTVHDACFAEGRAFALAGGV
jgi:hypothetical protein